MICLTDSLHSDLKACSTRKITKDYYLNIQFAKESRKNFIFAFVEFVFS